LFTTKKVDKTYVSIYEGKMIAQYNPNFKLTRYFTDSETAKINLLDKEIVRIKRVVNQNYSSNEIKKYFIANNYNLDFENYRLVFRAIGRSTDEKTLISTIIPPNNFTVNSLNYLIANSYIENEKCFEQIQKNITDVLYIMTLFNSLTLNYYIRNKISANLNMFYIYELPIPEVSAEIKHILVEKSFQLLYANSVQGQFEALGNEIGIAPRKIDALTERAEIEIIIAKTVFGLNAEEWAYLCSTFVYGKSESKQELDEIIKLSVEKY